MDSERPIEKKLREYAASRRERQGAPPELHPATRAVLQGEVARTCGRARGTGAAEKWWQWPWPKLAWACLILAFAGMLWTFAPQSPRKGGRAGEVELALHRADGQAPGLITNTVTSAFAPAEVAFKQEETLLAERGRADARFGAGATPALDSAATPPPAAVPASEPAVGAPIVVPLSLESSASTTVALRNARDEPGQNVAAMMFLNQAPSSLSNRAGAQNTLPAVLANFQVDQQGDRLRILDSDGSIYSGAARPLAAVAARVAPVVSRDRAIRRSNAEPASPATSAPLPAAQAVQNYSFEVVGTNRTLNQRVVFTGVLLEDTAAVSTSGAAANAGAPASNNVQLQSFSNIGLNQGPVANRRISGKALVGNSQELPVEAVPAP